MSIYEPRNHPGPADYVDHEMKHAEKIIERILYLEGRGFGFFGSGFFGESEIETLKRYRDHLELRKKDIETELKCVDERIVSLEKL